jgi:hypothetical protein
MSNLRIIYDNAIDRASLVASTTAGALVAANLLSDIKSDVWRSTATIATITATFTTPELIAGVVIPFCNFTSLATVRVRGYTNVGDATPIFDTGAVLCSQAPLLGLWGWGTPLGANAFSYGGGVYARVWVDANATPAAVMKLVVDINDTTNPSGYIEAGRLVAGNYWSPTTNVNYGAAVTTIDTSKQLRNDAGDLLTDNGTRHRKQTLNLSAMSPTDRALLWNILAGNGLSRPMLLSLFPNDADSQLEQSHQMYCKLVVTPIVSIPYFNNYAASFDLEEL